MKRLIVIILCLGTALTACVQKPAATEAATEDTASVPATPFDYDAGLPFDTKVISETVQDDVTVVDLNYAAHDPAFAPITAGRTLAYLVTPAGEGPFAGIVFLHRRLPSGSRSTFLDEALALAQRGAVSLLVQGFYPYQAVPKNSAEDRPNIVGQAIEMRRAVDFLLSQPGVDPERIGFVGQDYGGLYGSVLAGVDDRLKTFVLVAPLTTFAFSDGYEFDPPADYIEQIGEDLEPGNYVSSAAPASLFFQFANNDNKISAEMYQGLADGASEPKQVSWYDDLHAMESEAVLQERDAWLGEQLALEPAQP
jgi:dienelactone hydrolase